METDMMDKASRGLREFQHKLDRINGEAASIKCEVCGRKVTVVNYGMGDTLLVCRHFYEALKAKCKPDEMMPECALGIGRLDGFHIELLNDEPRPKL